MLHGHRRKTDPFHDCRHGLRRPKIPQISDLSFREIFIIEPIRRLLRAQVAENKAAAKTEDLESITQHAGLGLKMMKGKLAADEIKAQGRKGECRSMGLHPGDARRLAPGLPQHTYDRRPRPSWHEVQLCGSRRADFRCRN